MSHSDALPSFLGLSAQDQRDAYLFGSTQLNRSATVLEKDVWVCWALDALFSCPDVPNMAFKGGTSLSKVFDAISRFSEDIDVTMDHKGLAPDLDPYDPTTGSNQKDRDTVLLNALLCQVSNDVVVPHLRSRLADVGVGSEGLEIEKSGAELRINYPRFVSERDAYYREGVKIEFGGRNMIEPNAIHAVAPYMVAAFGDYAFPAGEVSVLSPMRTFWEKVTLAHAESNRPEFRNAERISRHWYDIAVLADHDIGRNALLDLDLLRDVVRVKNRFFKAATSKYDLCLEGRTNLLPDATGVDLLRVDYQEMVDARMLDEPWKFDDVIERLRGLEDEINRATAG